LVASAFASSAAPASPIWLLSRLSCAEPSGAGTAWSNGHRIQRQRVSLASPHRACIMPRLADLSQRVIGRQCLRKLRSTSITDMVAAENELCRVEQGRHSVGQRASHPTSMCASPRPTTHAAPHATADTSQRVVGRQCLRKLRSAGIADLIGAEIELRRAERSRHSVGQWASHPTSTCVPRPSPSRMHRATPCGPESACGWLQEPSQAPRHQHHRFD